jgi:hypothetical protein
MRFRLRFRSGISGHCFLSASQGYYDPLFTAEARAESATDSGGFDPADFSRDAIYSADSDVARAGLIGFLPSGLSYALSGNYAHSYGLRNGLNFDSYALFTGISVRQPLLKNFWIDQARLAIRVNKKNLKITELGVVYMAMDVVNRVQQAYTVWYRRGRTCTFWSNCLRRARNSLQEFNAGLRWGR